VLRLVWVRLVSVRPVSVLPESVLPESVPLQVPVLVARVLGAVASIARVPKAPVQVRIAAAQLTVVAHANQCFAGSPWWRTLTRALLANGGHAT
jgi:hypothetical protein